VAIHGLPTQLASQSKEELTKVICDQMQIQTQAIRYLFHRRPETRIPNYQTVVFAVHPDVRRKIEKMNRHLFLEQANVVVEFSDFHQPPQCSQCFAFGHTKTKCKSIITCHQCVSQNCQVPKEQICPQLQCRNCGEQHLSTSRQCPTYQRLIAESKQSILDILKSPILQEADFPLLDPHMKIPTDSQIDPLPPPERTDA
jgi:hypothetical protein